MRMPGVFSAVVLLCFAWMSAHAAPAPQSPAQNTAPNTDENGPPIPVEQLLVDLAKGKKSPSALNIKKIYEALNAKQYGRAKSLAGALRGDAVFADYAPGLSAEALAHSAKERLLKKDWIGAETEALQGIALLSEIQSRYPYSRFNRALNEKFAIFELVIGESLAARSKWESAQKKYESAFVRVSQERFLNLLTVSSVHRYAQTCLKRKKPFCDQWLKKFIDVYPKAAVEIADMKEVIGDTIDLERVLKSDRAYERLSTSYKIPDGDVASIDEALKLYLAGERSDAREKFEEFLKNFPRSNQRSRARYWLAQILTKNGKKEDPATLALYEDILRESPTSYYGLLASLAMGRSLDALMETSTPLGSREEKALEAKERNRMQNAEILYKAGTLEAAREELTDFAIRPLHSSEFLIYLAALQSKVGNDQESFTVVNELIQRKQKGVFAGYMIQLVFPVRFELLIEKMAREARVDPTLVMSLIKQESAFSSDALSRSGAQGLMQIMPFTAVGVDSKAEMATLLDTNVNVRLGTQYLAELLKKYDGNWSYVLAAYNAGPSRVDQWRKESKPEWGLLEFIESIPFKETRDYVSSIIRHYVWYSYLMHGKKMQSLEYFWSKQGPQPDVRPLNKINGSEARRPELKRTAKR